MKINMDFRRGLMTRTGLTEVVDASCVNCVPTCPTHAVCCRELRQVRLVLLQII